MRPKYNYVGDIRDPVERFVDEATVTLRRLADVNPVDGESMECDLCGAQVTLVYGVLVVPEHAQGCPWAAAPELIRLGETAREELHRRRAGGR